MNLRLRLFAGVTATLLVSGSLSAAISFTNGSYTQNFNTVNGQVSTAGVYTWTDDSVVPGWYATVNGATATQYRATNGGVTSTSPAVWLARTSGTEAALGLLAGARVGASFVNNTGLLITQLAVAYRGEQWSYTPGAASDLTCEYSTDATTLGSGTWTAVPALHFVGPKSGNTSSQALDGNATGNNQALTATISNLAIAPGQSFWMRWTANTGGGQALAVDDYSVTPTLAPVSLLPADALTRLTLSGGSAYGTLGSVTAVADAPVTEARLLTITTASSSPSGAQLGVAASGNITTGDVILMSFYVRPHVAATDEVRIDAVLEQNVSPYAKAVWRREYAVGDAWKRCDVAFVSPRDLATGEAVVHLRCGFKPQAFDIGGLSLINFGATAALQDLPNTVSYGGQGASAPWRAEAAARIEQYRKGDLTVTVLGADGQPIPGAAVSVQMTRNAFGFGSAVRAPSLLQTGADDVIYQNTVLALFNQVTLENDLKWPSWEANSQRPVAAIAWLHSHQIDVRGHNLIWPKLGQVVSSATGNLYYRMPADCVGLAPEALRTRINTAFHDRISPLVGQLLDWDVLNEPFNNYDVQGQLPGVSGVTASDGILGNAEMRSWFALARQEDAGVRLFLNDNGVGINNAQNEPLHQYTETLIHYLQDGGAPIDGLGIQGHFEETTLTDIPTLKSVFDRYAALGVRLKITEFDFYTLDASAQAQYLRDVLTLAYSHPAMDGFVMWGFWDGNVYQPGIGLFAADWSRKPAGDAWVDLVGTQWRTDASGTTDAQGKYAVRAYTGEYLISVSVNGYPTLQQSVTVGPEGVAITLTEAPLASAGDRHSPAGLPALRSGIGSRHERQNVTIARRSER